MIALLLTFAAMFLASYLFYASVPAEYVPALQVLLLLLLTVVFVILSLQFVRRRSEKIAGERLPGEGPSAQPAPAATTDGEVAVAHFLAQLQEKGRLVDFAMDDIAPYSDPQVAAAARVVHQGCREVLRGAFDLQPVHGGKEGETVTLGGDYDAGRYRLVGKVPDRAPFRGTVLHRGWRTGRIDLPRAVGSGETVRQIIAPAEVEIV